VKEQRSVKLQRRERVCALCLSPEAQVVTWSPSFLGSGFHFRKYKDKGDPIVEGEILSQPLVSKNCWRGGWVQSFRGLRAVLQTAMECCSLARAAHLQPMFHPSLPRAQITRCVAWPNCSTTTATPQSPFDTRYSIALFVHPSLAFKSEGRKETTNPVFLLFFLSLFPWLCLS